MLRNLSIQDVVLIDRLEIDFHPGLCVLSGETGAGKSILLDALGLALGVRAEARLVRHGAARAVAVASFEVAADHPARRLLGEHGLEDAEGAEGALILRRVLGADGRSRAFVNDQPVSVSLLRGLGQTLVETHGQFENQRLLDVALHRDLLDTYGGLAPLVAETGETYRAWRLAAKARAAAAAELETARHDEDFLRHAAAELAEIAPKPGEETELAEARSVMMHAEKLLEAMNQAAAELDQGRGAEAVLQSAARTLERVADKAAGSLDGAVVALSRAAAEAAEGAALLATAAQDMELDAGRLEAVEERLFALRALARKHAVEVDALAALGEELTGRLAALEDGGDAVERLRRDEAAAREAYAAVAHRLGEARGAAAARFDGAVDSELAPLKLGQARFSTGIETAQEKDWGERGWDRVAFQVATNPGVPPGPINRISSGGELARFMLALKVALARADPVPTMVFDEVDHGVGGAVAAAVGDRLVRLADDFQVLVVTHSPQVAACGGHHWLVSKSDTGGGAVTAVRMLSEDGSREEIARMLAGARITDEARAAAESLIEGQQP